MVAIACWPQQKKAKEEVIKQTTEGPKPGDQDELYAFQKIIKYVFIETCCKLILTTATSPRTRNNYLHENKYISMHFAYELVVSVDLWGKRGGGRGRRRRITGVIWGLGDDG